MGEIISFIVVGLFLAVLLALFTAVAILWFVDWAVRRWVDNSTDAEIIQGVAWLVNKFEEWKEK